MTPGLRRRSLAALRRVLTTQQAALFLPPCGSDSTGNASTACLPDVASAAWRLAVLSSDLGDAELAVSLMTYCSLLWQEAQVMQRAHLCLRVGGRGGCGRELRAPFLRCSTTLGFPASLPPSILPGVCWRAAGAGRASGVHRHCL